MTTSGKPTFQHISILAHYLRLQEAIEQKLHNIKAVDIKCLLTIIWLRNYKIIRPSYPWHISGRPTEAADENYVVVQPKYGEHIKEIRDLTKEEQISVINNLSPDTLQQLHAAIKYAALWDIRNNIMVNTYNTDQLWYGDLEQPNNSGEFFYQGKEGFKKYQHDVSVGLQEIGEKLQSISENKFELWQALSKEK
jgi:hypothetical protein